MLTREDITTAVNTAVEKALGAEPEEITPEATLLADLDAESIDLLDILFRIERSIGVKIAAAELAEYVQGGIPDDEFGDENEIVTERGLAHLKTVMPQIDVAALRGSLAGQQVMALFTVDNLVTLVQTKAEAPAPVTAGV